MGYHLLVGKLCGDHLDFIPAVVTNGYVAPSLSLHLGRQEEGLGVPPSREALWKAICCRDMHVGAHEP